MNAKNIYIKHPWIGDLVRIILPKISARLLEQVVLKFKVKESRYFALFVFSGSSIMLFSIFIFSQYFFNRFCPEEKCGINPHCLNHDSLTLIAKILENAIEKCL